MSAVVEMLVDLLYGFDPAAPRTFDFFFCIGHALL
jgi:hypothetical protein